MEFKNIPIASPEAIAHTIRTDPLVARWFDLLLNCPEFRERWGEDNNVNLAYQALQKLRRPEMVVIGLQMSIILAAIWWPSPLLFLGLITFWPYQIIQARKVRHITAICIPAITADFPGEQLTFTSLYQLGEFYSTKYLIPSFVDAAYHFDRAIRLTILVALLATWLIIPLPIAAQIITALLMQLAAYHFLRSDFVFKNLR